MLGHLTEGPASILDRDARLLLRVERDPRPATPASIEALVRVERSGVFGGLSMVA